MQTIEHPNQVECVLDIIYSWIYMIKGFLFAKKKKKSLELKIKFIILININFVLHSQPTINSNSTQL